MEANLPSNNTQSAAMVPMVPPMEMKTSAENETDSSWLNSSPGSEEDDDIDMIMCLTAVHVCPLAMALGCLIAHP